MAPLGNTGFIWRLPSFGSFQMQDAPHWRRSVHRAKGQDCPHVVQPSRRRHDTRALRYAIVRSRLCSWVTQAEAPLEPDFLNG